MRGHQAHTRTVLGEPGCRYPEYNLHIAQPGSCHRIENTHVVVMVMLVVTWVVMVVVVVLMAAAVVV